MEGLTADLASEGPIMVVDQSGLTSAGILVGAHVFDGIRLADSHVHHVVFLLKHLAQLHRDRLSDLHVGLGCCVEPVGVLLIVVVVVIVGVHKKGLLIINRIYF